LQVIAVHLAPGREQSFGQHYRSTRFDTDMACAVRILEGTLIVDVRGEKLFLHFQVINRQIPEVTLIHRGTAVAQLKLPAPLRIKIQKPHRSHPALEKARDGGQGKHASIPHWSEKGGSQTRTDH
jgi:hypothetical protein